MTTANPSSARRPNIVVVLMDNLGYGEIGCYGGGILRGAETPRLDALAQQGMRLLNFNVEAQCTPSRAALMTGRYPIRSGNASVPFLTPVYGLMRTEVTVAKVLSDAGYATGAFGKWHLGRTAGRLPTDHGFDEWYGIPDSSDQAQWPSNPLLNIEEVDGVDYEYVMEARRGEEPRIVKLYDMDARIKVDREITDKAIDFFERKAGGDAPFFAYIPYTQTHYPVLPHPDFEGSTGKGHWADVLKQVDTYIGELLDSLDRLKLRDDTIFIFTSDNGPEMAPMWAGSSGPWRGTYFTGLEGSLRVPFIVRWPGKVPAGAVSNEIVHLMDVYPTLARAAGAQAPTDRVIDGVDQLDFLTMAQTKSNRESVMIYVGEELYGVKWRDWKVMFKEVERGGEAVQTFSTPRLFNLLIDPKEELSRFSRNDNFWVLRPVAKLLKEHRESLAEFPPIKAGSLEPGDAHYKAPPENPPAV